MKLIYDIFRYAHAAYQGKEYISKRWPNSEFLESDLDFGFISYEPERTIVAFMGTGTLVKSNWREKLRDWLSNLNATPIGGDYEHKGFKEGFAPFADPIRSALTKPAVWGKKIYICGHSRGGALANHAARLCAEKLTRPCSCLRYGAPAVGGREYRNDYNMLPIDDTLIINGHDPVPLYPMKAIGYVQTGKSYQIKPEWYVPNLPLIRVGYHLPDNYLENLKKLNGIEGT